jgi:hypothetical protein
MMIEPREVATGELYSISVTVTNTGGSQGSYDVVLYIDEIVTEDPENIIITPTDIITKSVVVAAGDSKEVTSTNGTFTATIDEMVDYFEVGC